MLPVFPVYTLSACISKSVHAGALPGPTYPYFDNHQSTEIHTVSWVPGPWVVKTTKVFGDSQTMILDGHDTGMLIPHISAVMDNALLPLTLLSSSCSWPFVSFSKQSATKSGPKGIVGFFPAYAPFLFCDAEAPDKEKGKDGKPKKASSSDKVQNTAAGDSRVKRALAKPPKKLGAEVKLQKKLDAFGEKTGYRLNLGGRGRICIPTSATVMMQLSFGDLMGGWVKFLFTRSLDALFGVLMKRVSANKKNLLEDRFDNDVARQFAEQSIRQGILDPELERGVAKMARREIYEAMAVETGYKAMFDGVLKSVAFDGKIKMPFGVLSYGIADAKGTVLWWKEFDGIPTPLEFKGLKGYAMPALKDMCYQPAVNELVKDNPNYAGAPKEG